MSKQDVQKFFQEHVFGFIFSDIQREIDLACSGKPAGNFLSVLGLLCYIEFMGGIAKGSFSSKRGEPKRRFDAVLNSMGDNYKEFNQKVNVYDIFRCGMLTNTSSKGIVS
jgi:hypothetical protein